MADLYSSEKSWKPSGFAYTVYGRCKVTYSVTQTDDAVTVAGNIYTQVKESVKADQFTQVFAINSSTKVTYNGNTKNGTNTTIGTAVGHAANTYVTSPSLGSFSYVVSRTHSAQTKALAVSSSIKLETGGVNNTSTVSGSVNISIPARPSYAVSYNANGGSDAPAGQTKWYGENLTLQASVPTRNGYSFKGWNTKADGTGTNYAPSSTYTGNAALTLYAVWEALNRVVVYDDNGVAHEGNLYVYDSDGNKRIGIINVYDENGNKRNIQ